MSSDPRCGFKGNALFLHDGLDIRPCAEEWQIFLFCPIFHEMQIRIGLLATESMMQMADDEFPIALIPEQMR